MRDSVHIDGELRISAGQATDAGAKPANEDCMGLCIPEGHGLTTKGVAAVIADGVSSAEAGREASESCVQGFLADYYSTPESWSVKQSGHAVLTALNRWLYSRGREYQDRHRGYVTTFSAVVFKSHSAHLFHVGDSRIYRLRQGELELLTRDHATRISSEQSYLSRAMGLDVGIGISGEHGEIPCRKRPPGPNNQNALIR